MQNLLIEHPDVLEEYVDAPPVGAEGYSKLLAATGRASLPRLLSVRLAELYWPLVRERLLPCLEEAYPLALVSPSLVSGETLRDALRRVLEGLMGGGALDAYPELRRMEGVMRKGYVTLVSELLLTLAEERGRIARTFLGGQDFGRVTKVRLPDATNASTRPGGRTTLLLESESGNFYYKPRSCEMEALYGRVTARLLPELGPGVRFVAGRRSSFVEGIVGSPARTAEEAEAYDERLGMLSALCLALHAGDMHPGNVVACGSVPVPVDLECLLPWQMPAPGVPPRVVLVPVGGGEAFIAGFSTAFRRLVASRDDLRLLLGEERDAPVRVVLRHGRTYATMLRGMLAPGRLLSAGARDAWLERAWDALPEGMRSLYRELERPHLLNLDVPVFHLPAGGTTLLRSDGSEAARDWSPAPLDCAGAWLDELKEERLEACLAQVRGSRAGMG